MKLRTLLTGTAAILLAAAASSCHRSTCKECECDVEETRTTKHSDGSESSSVSYTNFSTTACDYKTNPDAPTYKYYEENPTESSSEPFWVDADNNGTHEYIRKHNCSCD